jgi:hypothetical protein
MHLPRLIAGGDHALRHPVEGAEDSREDCIGTLRSLSPPVGPEDSVIGIASSGRTPWVLGGVEYAKSIGCFTAGIACASPSALRTEGNCEEVVECVVGGEVVTGSTRMKAGTATKLVCDAETETRARRSIDTPYTECRVSSAVAFNTVGLGLTRPLDPQHDIERCYDPHRQDIWQPGKFSSG